MKIGLNNLVKTLNKVSDKDIVRRRNNCFSQTTIRGKKYINAISLAESSILTTLILDEEAVYLEYLYASGIKNLSEINFHFFLNLKYLDLSYCNLKGNIVIECPKSNLKEIYLQGNQIESIRFIGSFEKLHRIDLCDNQLKKIKFEGTFHYLHYLYLNKNQLKKLI